MLRAVVPGFADGAAVFVLERLLSGDPAEPAGTGPAEPLVRRLAAGPAPAAAQDAFPSGEVIALPADSPLARCVREGGPVIYRARRRDAATNRRRGRTAPDRYAAFLAAPVMIRGTTAGFLVLARGPAARRSATPTGRPPRTWPPASASRSAARWR